MASLEECGACLGSLRLILVHSTCIQETFNASLESCSCHKGESHGGVCVHVIIHSHDKGSESIASTIIGPLYWTATVCVCVTKGTGRLGKHNSYYYAWLWKYYGLLHKLCK